MKLFDPTSGRRRAARSRPAARPPSLAGLRLAS